jgi:putative membrane protein
MIFEILIAVLLGCFFGIFTGLIPGVHINLISLLLLSISGLLLNITSPMIIAILIISMAITHTFLDTIPSIFLGAPDSDTALSVLPGHSMLLEGKGYEAVMLTLIGSFFALILAIILSPLIGIIIKIIYPYLEKFMALILISASCFLIFREKKKKILGINYFFNGRSIRYCSIKFIFIKKSIISFIVWFIRDRDVSY